MVKLQMSLRAHVRGTMVTTGSLLVALLLPLSAAAEPSATDKAAAEALFDQGKDLMRAGKFDDACPKFAESQRLDPGVGTLLGLAECYERTGRIASAWATFREASALARVSGDARRDGIAQQRSRRLEPDLPRLVVVAAPPDGVELSVTDGSSPVAKAAWGAPLPVDPGEHVIRASAPGRREWTAAVRIERGETKTVQVPELEKVPEPETVAPRPIEPTPLPATEPSTPMPSAPADRRSLSPLTLGAFAAGVVGLGVGAVFGLTSLDKTSELEAVCKPMCPPDRSSDLDAARTEAWISNIGFGVAVVGIAVGTVSLFRDRARPSARRRDVTPTVASDGRASYVGLIGRF